MFCYSEKCNGKHKECELVKNLNNLSLVFNDFTSVENIDMARDVLCLVTSWEEPPYFIVMNRNIDGMANAFDGTVLDNTKILKWAYLPENVL